MMLYGNDNAGRCCGVERVCGVRPGLTSAHAARQFPAQMEDLVPCTQLYVSIDASNAAELKEIDRCTP